MRQKFKNIIRYLKLGCLIRKVKRMFYYSFDFLGYVFSSVLRFFYLLPKTLEFSDEGIKKILIIRLDRIGDVILSTPSIRAMRKTFPKAEIHLLISSYTKELVINNPNINRLLIFKENKLDKDYDLAIALHPGIAQNYLTLHSGARFRIGYIGWGGGFFLTRKLKDDRVSRIRHEVESALEVVGAAGCEIEDKRLEVSITDYGEKFAQDFFRQHNLGGLNIVIHPGARQEYIRWKKEGFAEVADRLIQRKNARIILIGSESEKALVDEVASSMTSKPICVVGLQLTQLVSLIKRCSLFIGNSSGPMHIAAALKIPLVAIFGATHPLDSYQEWGPWGEGHIVVTKNTNCRGCHPSDCFDFKCMELISPEDVFNACEKQLARAKQGNPYA